MPTRTGWGSGGWSYGGILTDYTIATDPLRFKAAISGASSALQAVDMASISTSCSTKPRLGPPWKSQDLWLKVSYPFFHADRIKTPTLYAGRRAKTSTCRSSAPEQMYQALKSSGVDTQLVVYPGQHHGLSIPSYQRDRLERWVGWFDKY